MGGQKGTGIQNLQDFSDLRVAAGEVGGFGWDERTKREIGCLQTSLPPCSSSALSTPLTLLQLYE